MHSKTITAIATPEGTGALAVIRLSGDDCFSICQPLCDVSLSTLEPKKQTLVTLKDPTTKKFIDQAILVTRVAPDSYTGENMIEIYSHGGVLIPRIIQSYLIDGGASPADPGEFTYRAVINKKMDILTAESIQQMIQSQTDKELAFSHGNFAGLLKKDLLSLSDKISSLITTIDASLCFPEDMQEEDLKLSLHIESIEKQIDILLRSGTFSKQLQKGYQVLISGKTNVGKSSIFNTLLGWERMKVSPFPSTTHDYVSERLDLEGFPVYLIDSAGFTENPGSLDELFNHTIDDLIETAFLVLFVLDITDIQDFDISLFNKYKKDNLILVLNKMDLVGNLEENALSGFPNDIPTVILSTQTKEGLPALVSTIVSFLKKQEPEDTLYLINERQNLLLQTLKRIVTKIRSFPSLESSLDKIRFELKEAIHILEEINGEQVREDIYNQIFTKFCIGK
jgi:tRNA modification GTPase